MKVFEDDKKVVIMERFSVSMSVISMPELSEISHTWLVQLEKEAKKYKVKRWKEPVLDEMPRMGDALEYRWTLEGEK